MEHQHQHLEEGEMRSTLNQFTPAQAPQQDGNAKPYNAKLSVAHVIVQISCLAGLCLHNQITQVVLHRRWTTQTQQQCTTRSQLGNIKTSLLAYKHHPDTLESRGTTTITQTTNKKGFTGWWNPNYTSTIPQKVYINRRNTNIPSKR